LKYTNLYQFFVIDLKRIINSALDALVKLDSETTDVTARATELAAAHDDSIQMSSGEITSKDISEDEENEESFLNNQIKELQSLLTDDKKEYDEYAGDVQTKREETSDDKREVESTHRKEFYETSTKKEAVESRAENANVVIDNDSLKELVHLVVRTVEDERKDKENKREVKVREEKKEIIESKVDEKKEAHEDEKKESATDEKREMCNTRKKECVEKKTTIIADKKMTDEEKHERVGAVNESEVKEDSREIREMVNELLDGKDKKEREEFASLLENIFEKTSAAEQQKKNIKP